MIDFSPDHHEVTAGCHQGWVTLNQANYLHQLLFFGFIGQVVFEIVQDPRGALNCKQCFYFEFCLCDLLFQFTW